VHPIHDLQIEYSLISRSPEQKIFPALDELDIRVTAYGILSRGLLSGSLPAGKSDLRAHLPRFSGDNLTRNRVLIERLNTVAKNRGVTPTQLAIAWVMAKRPNIIPVIGSRTRTQLVEALGALEVKLTPAEVKSIEDAIPIGDVAGTRYAEPQMTQLDSER
jgi:aryl-alcohol dehydrogenase-like predicted oxidoreductase